MSSDEATLLTPLPHQRWFTGKKIRFVICVLVVMAFALYYYRFHLSWCFMEWQSPGLRDIHATPTFPMPDTPTPKDWVKCRFASLRFSLPRELADTLKIKAVGPRALLTFEHSSRTVTFLAPVTTEDQSSPLPRDAGCLMPDSPLPGQKGGITMIRFCLAMFPISADDFRWSMTPEQARRHLLNVTLAGVGRLSRSSTPRAEYIFRNNLEGILEDPSDSVLIFSWGTTDDQFGGTIFFKGETWQSDLSWVRSVCQSLEFSPDELLKAMPEKDRLLELFHQNP